MRARTGTMIAAAALTLAACTSGADPDPRVTGTPDPTATPDAIATPASSTGHVDNAYAGAAMYVNRTWSAHVLATADGADDAALADAMRDVADEPTAVWLDRIAAIDGTDEAPGLRAHLDAALEQAAARADGAPVAVTIVVYDLPGRDCFALASNGELPATDDGFARYREDFIDPIAAILADEAYADLRIVAVLEPDSLPNLVTNASHGACQEAAPYYRDGMIHALDAFAPLENVYAYLDAAHSGWLGWPDNAGGTVQLFAEVARATEAGFASIDGFVTDTANTTPLVEPFLTASAQVGGQEVRSSSFYEFNPDLDEVSWAADLWSRLVGAGFPETTGIVIDTSRNGWGGPARPAAASTSSDLETFVAESRVDRRVHRGAWCNPSGAGLGMRPQALPSGYPDAHLDAFVWVKPPGESDGSSSEIANDQGKGFDRMCDPTYVSDRLGGQLTGALPDAPISGGWFAAQFAELVANAYPPVGVEPPPSRDEPSAYLPVDEAGSGADPSPPSTPSASTSSAAAPNVDPGDGCAAALVVTNTWSGGYQADVTVTAGPAISGWTVTLAAGTAVDQVWNGAVAGLEVGPADWNASLPAGGTATFGFTGSGDAPAVGELACRAS